VTRDAASTVTRRRVGAWLQLEATLVTALTPLAALERNRGLGGLAKLALAANGGGLQLRAELPTDADGDLTCRIRDTEAGMAEAVGDGQNQPMLAEERPSPPARLEAGALAELCEAAGWPCTASQPHKIAVDLGLRDVFARARVEQSAATGAVRVSAELEVVAWPLAEMCGEALAVFLLRIAAVVRLVRPFIEHRQAHAALGFEAGYATPPGPRELAHALAALRVAAEMTSREVGVLARDPRIARAYLAINDTHSRVDPSGTTTTASVTLAKGET
jgi:hypothetical protein